MFEATTSSSIRSRGGTDRGKNLEKDSGISHFMSQVLVCDMI
jgi:hypothetical protein